MYKKSLLFYLTLILLNLNLPVLALENYYSDQLDTQIISATPYQTNRFNLGLRTEVLNEYQLNQFQITSPEDLNTALNLFISPAGTHSLFLNGLPSNYTKIQINGISLTDQSTPQGTPYLDDILVSDFSRVELIKNATSLAGSGAISGLLNFLTIPNANKLSLDLGDNRSLLFNSEFFMPIAASTYLNCGYSVLNSLDKSILINTSEKDRKTIQNLNLNYQKIFDEKSVLNLAFFASKSDQDLDNYISGTQLIDDPNYKLAQERFLGKVEWNSLFYNHHYNFTYTFANLLRNSQNPTDNIDPLNFSSALYKSKEDTFSFHILEENQSLKYLYGIKYNLIAATSAENWNGWPGSIDQQYGESTLFTQLENKLPFASILLSGNLPIKKETCFTYSTAAIFPFPWVNLKTAFSTGFREPSLYEKYSDYGSPTLKSELGQNLSIGLEKNWDKLSFNLDYNEVKLQNKIDYNFATNTYQNISDYAVNNCEAGLSLKKIGLISLAKLGYIQNFPQNQNSFIRIPKNNFYASCILLIDRAQILYQVFWKGQTQDSVDGKIITMEPYFIVNTAISYIFNTNSSLTLKANNLLNTQYSDVYGYNGDSRNIHLKYNYSF